MDKCKKCGSENIYQEVEERVIDYFDPTKPYGHGQMIEPVFVDICGDCGYYEVEME